MNELTNQPSNSEIFYPEERIKELELRTQQRNNFEEELFKDRCFVYVVEFMILEDLGSIIDSGLSEVVLVQPFAHTSKLTYDDSLGLIRLYLMRKSLEDFGMFSLDDSLRTI
ncbi:hypothetical protein Tco_0897214 [Tanacetum coccineum]